MDKSEENHGRLTAYHLQQLDCGYMDCNKWAVIGVIDPLGSLMVFCREHGGRANTYLLPPGWSVETPSVAIQ